MVGFLASQITARLASVLNLSLDQKYAHYKALLDATEAEIAVLLTRLNANRRMRVARLLASTPVQFDLPPLAPGVGQPALAPEPFFARDPNSPELQGMPRPPWPWPGGV